MEYKKNLNSASIASDSEESATTLPNSQRRRLLKSSLATGVLFSSANPASQAQGLVEKDTASNIAVPKIAKGLRLVTFSQAADQKPRIGVVLNDGQVIDIAMELQNSKMVTSFDPYSMLSLIHRGNEGLNQIQEIQSRAMRLRIMRPTVNQVKLFSPIPRPQSNIYAVGWNYLDHFEEGREARADKAIQEFPKNPVFFTKGVYTMNGPFDPIPFDATNSIQADWEVELALIIGKTGRNISEEKAMDYVYGYSVYNDTTLREVQQKRHGGQWFKGKSLDGYGPMGPWILTADAVDLNQTRLICRVNGVEKQNGTYAQMYFKIPRIIAELSRGLTLEAGDIIATGTPPGVGFSRKPPEFLKPGDVMESEVTGIGIIRNPIRSEV
jgi:2-keto-4-pentenoate hydratase/2-oxohepta-3-ene-1,7-dioic acid hydratase in catechol pathway